MQVQRLAIAALALAVAFDTSACRKQNPQPERAAVSRPPAPPPPPPPFTAVDTAEALEALRRAPEHGIPSARFRLDEIRRRLASAVPAERAGGQAQLRAAVLDYARAQHGLTIPTGALPRAWNQRPSGYDAPAELNAALRGGTMQGWLDALPPQTREYATLKAAYAAALHHRREPVEDATDAGTDPDANPETDSGADADAPVGMSRAERLRVNMERLRWLPQPQPVRRVDVNIASAELTYVREGQPGVRMLAVSGKLGDETPIVSSAIDSIVLNPPWYVPADIARREILPKGGAYMRARHFVWRGGRLIQQPGPKTALGLVKFDFPNPYAVYLHDTPSKASFGLARRTASHGCVRVQHAVELAQVVAGDEPGLSSERVDQILASGRTVRLKLAQPVPVRLMYLTAEAKGDAIAYPPDVYGWDPVLLGLLDRYSAPRRRRSEPRSWSRPAAGPAPGATAP